MFTTSIMLYILISLQGNLAKLLADGGVRLGGLVCPSCGRRSCEEAGEDSAALIDRLVWLVCYVIANLRTKKKHFPRVNYR